MKLKLVTKLAIEKLNLFECQIHKLISKYSEIEKIMKFDKSINLKLIYVNKEAVHCILYDAEKVIYLNSFSEDFANFFYLDLLILDNKNIVNYNYPKESIQKIDKIIMEQNYKIVKKVLFSKIIIDLINNFKETDIYNEKYNDEILKIVNNNKNRIKNNINIFKDFGLNFSENHIISKKIDKLYVEIIIGLIKNHKFEDYEYTYDLLDQLDFENIEITKYMFDELYKILKNEDIIKTYIISNEEDLTNINKINFYYILIKYIFKSPFYIYQIPFLLNTRKSIIKYINDNINQSSNIILDNNIILHQRKEYIIKMFTDSEFYFKKYLSYENNLKEKLKQILYYYEEFLFESKKNDINIIKAIIEKGQNTNYDKYLNDYESAIEMNKRLPIIKYLYNSELNNETEIFQNELNKYAKEWNHLEKMIKDKNYLKIRKSIKIKLINYFKDEKNRNIILNIFKEDEYKLFIKNNILLLNQKNDGNKDEDNFNENKLSSENIKSTNEKSILNSLKINLENDQKSKKEDTSIIRESYTIQTNLSNQEKNKSIFNDKSELVQDLDINNISKKLAIYKKSSRYKIIEFIKIIGNHKISEIIKNLSKGHYISCGTDKKLILYDKSFEIVLKINITDWVYNIYEIETNDKNQIKLMICCGEELLIILINIIDYEYNTQKYVIQTVPCISFYQLEREKCLISGNNGIYLISNLFNENQARIKNEKIINDFYRGGIQINKNIIAFTSNYISREGKDTIIFYNIKTKKVIKKIEGYPFIFNSNGLCLLSNDNEDYNINNNKILLCGCKKNTINRKNGILLVIMNLENGKENFYHQFYDTNNFEIYCFCQILDIKNDNIIDEDITNERNIKINKTDYFLVGGFEEEKREGMIKLYKIKYNKNINETKIIYIQDIVVKKNNDFEGFENAISCISQSKITGNIIATCWDGNVYLFNPPNIDFFLN